METPITEPVVQSASVEPQEPRSSKLLIPLVILLAVAAYFAVSYTQSLWPFEPKIEEVILTPTPSGKTAWKTYKNTEYGFQLTFTDAWEGYRVIKGSTTNGSSSGDEYPNYYIELPTSDPAYKTGYALPFSITVYTLEVFEKLKGIDYERAKNGELGRNSNYIFTNNNGTWQDIPKDLVNKGLNIAQVKSTFKFTTGADTTGWKTYTNAKYGFEVKYPTNFTLENDLQKVGGYLGAEPDFIKLGEKLAAIVVPNTYPANSDFDEAFVLLSLNKNLSKTECFSYNKVASNGVDLVSVKMTNTKVINGETFYSAESGGAGLSHQADNRFYHAFKNNICFEVLLGLRTSTGADGTVQSKYDDLFTKLGSVLSTFKFTGTTASLLRVCPEKWYYSQATIADLPDSEYYVYKGIRHELSEFDMNWVKANCPVNRETIR